MFLYFGNPSGGRSNLAFAIGLLVLSDFTMSSKFTLGAWVKVLAMQPAVPWVDVSLIGILRCPNGMYGTL